MTQAAAGTLKMIAAEGESLSGSLLRIGNTNVRLRFALPPAQFLSRWCEEAPTHHCALGIGRRLESISKLATYLKIPLAQVG